MDVKALKYALSILVQEMYPYADAFSDNLYSLEDVVNQLVFEIIKEEYKQYAPRRTIVDFLGIYDPDGSNRKYTRALQYAQHYRDFDNSQLETDLSLRVPELEAQDMSGGKKFLGHQFTAQEFLGLKLQAECSLLNKLHEGRIDSSKDVKGSYFCEMFVDYEKKRDELEPSVNDPESVICNTFLYFGIETHFLTEFLYKMTLAAEKAGFPKEIPAGRILDVCSAVQVIPDTFWCPATFLADFCMIPKWDSFCNPVFTDSNEVWIKKAALIEDCKHIKSHILQRNLEKLIELVHICTDADKARFIVDHYWIWDNRAEFDWNPNRISYYRKLHSAVMRSFPEPHIR